MNRYKLGFWQLEVITDNELGTTTHYRIPFRYEEEYQTNSGGLIAGNVDQRSQSIVLISDTRLEKAVDGLGIIEIAKDDSVELEDGKTRIVTRVDKIPNGRGGYSWTRRIYID